MGISALSANAKFGIAAAGSFAFGGVVSAVSKPKSPSESEAAYVAAVWPATAGLMAGGAITRSGRGAVIGALTGGSFGALGGVAGLPLNFR